MFERIFGTEQHIRFDLPESPAARSKCCHTQDPFFCFFVRRPFVEIDWIARRIGVTKGPEFPPGISGRGLDPICLVDPDIDGNIGRLERKRKSWPRPEYKFAMVGPPDTVKVLPLRAGRVPVASS
jgi:hypothetical protein